MRRAARPGTPGPRAGSRAAYNRGMRRAAFLRRALVSLAVLAAGAASAGNPLPRALGPFELGRAPGAAALPADGDTRDDSPRAVVDLKSDAAHRMWLSLVPDSPTGTVSASATLYRGRVEELDLFVPGLSFADAEHVLAARFGQGATRANLVPEVAAGCDPYFLQRWTSAGTRLFLIGFPGSDGVDVHLLDETLSARMSADESVHLELGLCLTL